MVDEKLDYIKGTSIKTLNYTPPEYFNEGSIYGKFSDIYQIGVVLHEMLNGRVFITMDKLPSALKKRFEKVCLDYLTPCDKKSLTTTNRNE